MKLLLLLLALAVLPARGMAEDEVAKFCAGLRPVFFGRYPGIDFTMRGDTATFEHNCRIYLIHNATKTGEWQDAVEERGPKKGGIYCRITVQNGPYQGAAAAPQTFDKRYFKTLFLVAYSKRLDRHLVASLSYPTDAPADVLRQFTEDFNRFNDF
jgi:hypothetical protein